MRDTTEQRAGVGVFFETVDVPSTDGADVDTWDSECDRWTVVAGSERAEAWLFDAEMTQYERCRLHQHMGAHPWKLRCGRGLNRVNFELQLLLPCDFVSDTKHGSVQSIEPVLLHGPEIDREPSFGWLGVDHLAPAETADVVPDPRGPTFFA